MKYLVFTSEEGLQSPVLFPDHISHIQVAMSFGLTRIVSAGFVEMSPAIRTYGSSESIAKSSRPQDALLIRALLSDNDSVYEVQPMTPVL